jgi:hypothetical protein
MGYYTMHSLYVHTNDPEGFTPELVGKISDALRGQGILGYALEDGPELVPDGDQTALWFSGKEPVSWYRCDEDMLAVSRLFPGCVFRLHGDGEDKGDLWYGYYMDGQMEVCQAEVVYPEPETIPWKLGLQSQFQSRVTT